MRQLIKILFVVEIIALVIVSAIGFLDHFFWYFEGSYLTAAALLMIILNLIWAKEERMILYTNIGLLIVGVVVLFLLGSAPVTIPIG